MRTNSVPDHELVAEAIRLTGFTTKRQPMHEALRTLVAMRQRKSLLDLAGRMRFAAGYDHRALRGDRHLRARLSSSVDRRAGGVGLGVGSQGLVALVAT